MQSIMHHVERPHFWQLKKVLTPCTPCICYGQQCIEKCKQKYGGLWSKKGEAKDVDTQTEKEDDENTEKRSKHKIKTLLRSKNKESAKGDNGKEKVDKSLNQETEYPKNLGESAHKIQEGTENTSEIQKPRILAESVSIGSYPDHLQYSIALYFSRSLFFLQMFTKINFKYLVFTLLVQQSRKGYSMKWFVKAPQKHYTVKLLSLLVASIIILQVKQALLSPCVPCTSSCKQKYAEFRNKKGEPKDANTQTEKKDYASNEGKSNLKDKKPALSSKDKEDTTIQGKRKVTISLNQETESPENSRESHKEGMENTQEPKALVQSVSSYYSYHGCICMLF